MQLQYPIYLIYETPVVRFDCSCLPTFSCTHAVKKVKSIWNKGNVSTENGFLRQYDSNYSILRYAYSVVVDLLLPDGTSV